MSGDLRPVLERARRHAPPSNTDLLDVARRRDRRSRRERGTAIIVALTLTLATLGAGTLLLLQDRDGGRVASTDVPQALEIGPGQSWYREVLVFGINGCDADMQGCGFSGPGAWTTPFPYVGRGRIELWWSPDGPARVVSRVLEPIFFSAEEEAEFVELNGPIEAGPDEVEEYGPGAFAETYPDDDPAHGGLSSNPAVLAGQLDERLRPDSPSPVIRPTPEVEGQGPDTPALVRVLQALLPNAQPSLQAALFDVASTWEGMQVREDATDPVGRAAIELSISTEGEFHAWLFEPENHQLLAIVESDRESDAYQATIVVASGIVSTLGDVPADGGGLVQAPLTEASPISDPRA